jgi:hypothetical protein
MSYFCWLKQKRKTQSVKRFFFLSFDLEAIHHSLKGLQVEKYGE